jgi:hypothetical protein
MKRSMVILLPLLSILSCHLFAQSPGGIKGQSFWLKGNFSPGNDRQGLMNFNPAAVLGDGKAPVKLPGNMESLRRVTIFTVYQNAGTVAETPVWEMTGEFGDILLTTRQVSSKSRKTNLAFAKNNPQSNKPGTAEAIIHTYLSCRSISPAAENTEYKEAAIRFGSLNAAQPVKASPSLLAEFILYEQILNEEEITKIETCLALKYGITLQKNYLNALGKTVWNWEKDKTYSNNIAGIARDDQAILNQKQGTSSNVPGELVIGINKVELLNSKNTGSINDKNYLIWGDNAGSSTLDQAAKTTSSDIILPAKKWLMRASGSTANTIATELKAATQTFLAGYLTKENFCLVIDRSGTGDFAPAHCEYMMPDNISADGIAAFSNIYWDTDGSGKDMFTFGLKQCTPPESQLNTKTINGKEATGLISFLLYPNPVTDGQYKMAITLDKPTDIQIQVYDGSQHLLETRKGSGQAAYFFTGSTNLPPGSYTVRLITPDMEVNKILIVQ